MDTPDFKIFSRAVHARYELLSKNELFTVDVICPLSVTQSCLARCGGAWGTTG